MASSPQEAANRRARARAAWPIRRFRLGEEPATDLLSTTTAAERLAMVEELTERAWTLSGRPLPSYERSEIPMRRVRVGGVRVDESGERGSRPQ